MLGVFIHSPGVGETKVLASIRTVSSYDGLQLRVGSLHTLCHISCFKFLLHRALLLMTIEVATSGYVS